ncbi:MAG: tRNA pseudouridine(38-40) synthase TruA [Candidatus Ranarchaeia archaeon]
MIRIAYRVSYDGRRYSGFQRQPNGLTVENMIINAFKALGVDLLAPEHDYSAASRTDRGVHALCQTIAVTYRDEPVVLRALNSSLPHDIAVWGYASTNKDFHPRYDAIYREYRYFFLKHEDESMKLLQSAARLFEGEHDFRYFVKTEQDTNTVQHVTLCEIHSQNHLSYLLAQAPNFLWHQIRKIVTTVRWVGQRKISLHELKQYLKAQEQPSSGIPLAPPEGLVLSWIEYPFEWVIDRYILKKFYRYWYRVLDETGLLLGSSKFMLKYVRSLREKHQ